MGYRNIIFDFDGTITDSKHDIAGAQLWVLEQLGVTGFQKEDLFRHIGKTLEETFSLILPTRLHQHIPDAAEMYAERYRPRALETTTLFPEVKETLEELWQRGKYLAVASTKRGPGIRRATDHFGITKYFVQLQGSENIPHKPDPFILNKIVTEQGWSKRETLMVGDTDKDMLAGKSAGIAICGVSFGALSEEELSTFRPDHMIASFSQLLSIV